MGATYGIGVYSVGVVPKGIALKRLLDVKKKKKKKGREGDKCAKFFHKMADSN